MPASFRLGLTAMAVVVVGLVMFILLGIPLGTWLYVQLNLSRAQATVLEKSEAVYHGYGGSWKHYFRLRVRYSPIDTRRSEQATIDVDETTWEQSRTGSPVEISYVPVTTLRQIPIYHTTRLAEPLRPLSPDPDIQRSATALVRNIRHITKVGGNGRSRAMTAWQPFDVVELSFLPEGRREAVTSVDSVDAGSVSNLAVGTPVTVAYSQRHPRAARIVGASREHAWKNNLEVFAVPGVAALLLLLLAARGRWHPRPRSAA
jgi:hypothetical protein